MKMRGVSVTALLAVVLSILTALPAVASTHNFKNRDDSTNAVGLIVKYKSGVNPVAPNGEPTGENFAGVDLENSRPMGDRTVAVEFAKDLDAIEAQSALVGIRNDPRVEFVQFDRFIEMASVKPIPIAGQILPRVEPKAFPIVLKSRVKLASLKPIVARDTSFGQTPRVTISWAKALSGYSGSVIGYRVQIYVGGVWRTLVKQTSSKARSFTTSSYLQPGTATRFRVAAVTKRYKTTYLGYYRYQTVTPTTAPRAINTISFKNNLTQLQVSYVPFGSNSNTGGLALSYSLSVKDQGNTQVACVEVAPRTCNVTALSTGSTYTATLVASNAKGSAEVSKSIRFNVPAAVYPNSNSGFNNQWHLRSSDAYSANVTDAWTTESGLEEVVVAVLDTGYTDHVDLPAASILPGYDFVSGDADPQDPGDFYTDDSGFHPSSWHGTHVSGIIAAADNSIGGVGIAPHVKILPVRVLGSTGGTTADLISGIYWAAGIHKSGIPDNPNRAHVINMSLGGYSMGCDSLTESALAAAKSAGVTVVTAAGNDNGSFRLDSNGRKISLTGLASESYPGNCYPTFNVGATGQLGKPAFYSNFSDPVPQGSTAEAVGVDISAPGGDSCQGGAGGEIYSTLNAGTAGPSGSGTYGYEQGTSMAAPVVSGVIALMYSAKIRQNPSIELNGEFVNKVWTSLHSTARPFASQSPVNCGGSGRTIKDGSDYGGYGIGIINAAAAVTAILQ